MRYSRFSSAAAIIAFVVVIGFALSAPHAQDADTTLAPESVAASVPIVSLHDSFKKGLHTITGSIETPNACTSVTADASFSEGISGGAILVALSLPEDAGVCLQIPTRVKFSATVSAPANLPIIVTVNGAAATTTAL